MSEEWKLDRNRKTDYNVCQSLDCDTPSASSDKMMIQQQSFKIQFLGQSKLAINNNFHIELEMKDITYFCFLFLAIASAHALTLSVNISDYQQLKQTANITAIDKDYQGNFYVGFTDSTARKYAPDFSSYVDLSFPEVVNQFVGRGFSMSTILSNGTSISMNDRRIIVKSNNLTIVRDYDYYTYASQANYTLNQTILHQVGFPLSVSSICQTFHVIIGTNQIMVAYKGMIAYSAAYSSIFGTGLSCRAAINYNFPIWINQDLIYARFIYFASISNNIVYQLNVNVTFSFNFTSNHYDFVSASYSPTQIYSSATPITYLGASSGLLMMQSNSTGSTTIYNVNTSTLGSTLNLPINRTLNFFYAYSTYYLLQSTGIFKLSFNPTTNTLSYLSSVVVLPQNSYSFRFGAMISPFYVPGQPYIYKGGLCFGRSLMSGASCVSYNCTVGNCSQCFISGSICSVCNTGYSLSNNYSCIFINTTTDISTLTSNPFYFPFISSLLLNSNTLYSQIISVPAARKLISPAFIYFGIFDDLYLYQFHDRLYGNALNQMFSAINLIQTQKWSFLNYKAFLEYLGINSDVFSSYTDYQNTYDTYPFSDADHTDVGAEGLWANCQNYLLITIPITIIGFLILRWIFKLLFNFPISMVFRRFDIWPFIFVILLDGNIQQLSFYLATEWKNMFACEFKFKMVKTFSIAFGFLVAFLSVGLYLISFTFYTKINRYLMDNNRNILKGHVLLMCQNGLKNMLLGIMHSILRGLEYKQMLMTLICFQATFNTIFLVSASTKIYEYTTKMWIYLVLNIIKLVLMGTLLLDYQNINNPTIEVLQYFLIFLEVSVFIFGVLYEIALAIFQCTSLAKKHCKNFGFKEKQQNQQVQEQNQQRCMERQLSRKGVVAYISNFDLKPQSTNNRIFFKEEPESIQSYCRTRRRIKTQRNFNVIRPGNRTNTRLIVQVKKQIFRVQLNQQDLL